MRARLLQNGARDNIHDLALESIFQTYRLHLSPRLRICDTLDYDT